jgi:hypothetical protein
MQIWLSQDFTYFYIHNSLDKVLGEGIPERNFEGILSSFHTANVDILV